ncbi:MAG TPA: restriction endonuclease [Ktedonobacteraceae bacterium]|nr:restriction endonuclease [Ktedonobacteraceae bacterium]
MGKHTTIRRQSSSYRRGRSRAQRRRRQVRKQSTLGLRMLLIGILLAMGVWALMQVSSDLLIIGGIVCLLIIAAMLVGWFVLRLRPTEEERSWQSEQRMELMQMEDTAKAIGIRPVELNDLAHLTDVEFEYFTGALLEAAGRAYKLARIGGAGDQGADLLGEDRFTRPFIVQCKQYFGHKVPSAKMREFLGAMRYRRAAEGWFVTTSSFTKDAEEVVAQEVANGVVVLRNGEQLVDLIRTCWDALPVQWQWRITECMVESDRRRSP